VIWWWSRKRRRDHSGTEMDMYRNGLPHGPEMDRYRTRPTPIDPPCTDVAFSAVGLFELKLAFSFVQSKCVGSKSRI